MTLQEAKDRVAEKHGLTSWENACFVWAGWVKQMEPHMDEAAELYARSKVSEALKLAESLAEKEKRELWGRCYEETANRTFAIGLKGIAPKPEYKP